MYPFLLLNDVDIAFWIDCVHLISDLHLNSIEYFSLGCLKRGFDLRRLEVGKKGDLRNCEGKDKVEVVILKQRERRALFSEPYSKVRIYLGVAGSESLILEVWVERGIRRVATSL